MTTRNSPNAETTIAVVGLGFLGRGIAACFLGYGFRVIGFARSPQSHEQARKYISDGLQEMIQHAGFDPDLLNNWQARYHETQRFDDWPSCDFVVESIAEDTAAKHDVYDQIEKYVGP